MPEWFYGNRLADDWTVERLSEYGWWVGQFGLVPGGSWRGSVRAVRKRTIVAIYVGSVLLVGLGGFAYQTLGAGGVVLLAALALGVAAMLYRARSRS